MRNLSRIAFVVVIFVVICVYYEKYAKKQVVPGGRERLTPARLDSRSLLKLPHPAELAVAAPPLVTGFLPKAGPAPLSYWLTPQQLRHTSLARWLNQTDGTKLRVEQDGLSLPTTPPLFPYCMINVNHRYRFIYIRHPKSASSTLMNYFTTCGEQQNFTDIEWQQDMATAAGAQQGKAGGGPVTGEEKLGLGSACMSGHESFARGMTPEQARVMWEEYFVFSVVRNPFARMVSAYKFLLNKMKEDPQCDRVRWGDFCSDPMYMGVYCQKYPHCCAVFPDFYWHHVIDQGRCLDTEYGNWAVDYIVPVEQFDQQMPEVIREINRRRAPGLPPLEHVTRPLERLNVAQQSSSAACQAGSGAALSVEGAEAAGAEGQQAGQQDRGTPLPLQQEREAMWLQEPPRQEEVLVYPPDGLVRYNASMLLDRHCHTAGYYQGPHSHCLAQIQHFHAPDFKALYPSFRTGAGKQGQQQQRQQGAELSGLGRRGGGGKGYRQ